MTEVAPLWLQLNAESSSSAEAATDDRLKLESDFPPRQEDREAAAAALFYKIRCSWFTEAV